MNSELRIIDANANRAREAMRVMEDAARFMLNDGQLAKSFKQLRHDLTSTLQTLNQLTLHRDTPNDVGTVNVTPTEQQRTSIRDIAITAGKRLGESLRTLEEFSKLEHAIIATQVEQIRYRGYELEKQLTTRLGSPRRSQFQLCLLLTESLCKRPWQDVVEKAIAGGVDCVQLREKNLADTALFKRARELVALIDNKANVIINDRPDIAMLSDADGVHLGQDDLPPRDVRKLVGSNMLIGISTSSLDQAEHAYEAGADYCGVGPMFTSSTKAKDYIVGPPYLQEYLEWNRLPHLAIGGINEASFNQLCEVGVRGIAVSAAICGAENPEAAANSLLQK